MLTVDLEIQKNEMDRLSRDNRDLNAKVLALQEKIETKNNEISQLKIGFQKKERENARDYEEKIKKLDNELKLSLVKIKNMEEEIGKLNKKIA